MNLVYEWARVVALAVLFAGLVEMLITSEDMARFVRLVLGLVVLLAIMSPALALMDQPWITTTGFLPAMGEHPLAAGNRAWEDGMSNQIVRLVESVEGIRDVQVRLTGSPTEGITSLRLWGWIQTVHPEQAMEAETAIAATLGAYYGVSSDQIEIQLEAEIIPAGGGERDGG